MKSPTVDYGTNIELGERVFFNFNQSATVAAWALVHGLSQILIDGLLSDDSLKQEQLPALVESVLGHLVIPG